jgi:hypothetical protein
MVKLTNHARRVLLPPILAPFSYPSSQGRFWVDGSVAARLRVSQAEFRAALPSITGISAVCSDSRERRLISHMADRGKES